MWMLNYPFPYVRSDVAKAFRELRDLLMASLAEADPVRFRGQAAQYLVAESSFLSDWQTDDRKYLGFQLWQEGIARYTQVKAAEAAAQYRPSLEYRALADFESFSEYAARARKDTLDELGRIDLHAVKTQRGLFVWGRRRLSPRSMNPEWRQDYFRHLLSTATLFENVTSNETRKAQVSRPVP